MSENLIQSVAPYLAPPVTREPIHGAGGTGDGAELAYPIGPGPTPPPMLFADDDAE